MNIKSVTAFALAVLVQLPARADLPRLAAAGSAPGEVSLSVDGGHLVLRPLLDSAVRIRFTRSESPPPSNWVLTEKVPTPAFRVREREREVVIEMARMQVRVDRVHGALAFSDGEGRVFLRALSGGRQLAATKIRGTAAWSIAQSFDSPPEERLFGAGEFQDGILNIRDLPRRLTQVNSQIAIPMVVSSRGFGLLWNNDGLTDLNPADDGIVLTPREVGATAAVNVTTAEGTRREVRHGRRFTGRFAVSAAGRQAFFLDVGQKMARRWQVSIDGAPVVDHVNVWLPPTTSWFTDLAAGPHEVTVIGADGDRPVLTFRPARPVTEFRSPVADGIDYVVIAGRGDEIAAGYRRLTGEVPLLPRWVLGYIHCRERYKSQDELLANAAEFRRRGLPIDVIVQDWQYWGRYGWNAMRFDEKDYPDPRSMIAQLHDEHIKFMLSVWSKADPSSEVGREFAAGGYFIPGTQWVDFFNPAAAQCYWDNVRRRLLPLGIDAWWQDATEPENDDLAGRETYAGPGERVRNLYPLLVTRTVYEGLRRDAPDRRAFILTRCAFPGEQRTASAVWSGDVGSGWESLRRQVTAGLGYVVTGLPWWTTDTGGFFRPGQAQYSDPDYHERFLRWLQFSTFSPLLRVHGYQTDTEPWRYGPRVEAETRRWLQLRYRLLPYIYSEMARVSFAGSTLMRPLVLDFPDDGPALDQTGEYMFGPALLVAPVLKPRVETWPVYLPESGGGWYDFWTGERHSGGSLISDAAPLERIPLHVRAGSLVPLGPELQFTSEKPADPIELRIYAGADADYRLYEDDGVSYGYERGARAEIPLHWDERKGTLTIGLRVGSFPGMLATRTFQVTWVRPGHGAGAESGATPDVTLRYDGQRLTVDRTGRVSSED